MVAVSEITPGELDALLACCVRYALGRRDLMPALAASLVRRHATADVHETILQDIRAAISAAENGYPSLGNPRDERVWRDLADWLVCALCDPDYDGMPNEHRQEHSG